MVGATRRPVEEGGREGYFASVSDLMVGILFVFLLMLTVFALNFRDAEQTQMIERKRYEQAVAEAIAALKQAALQEELARQQKAIAERRQAQNMELRRALDAAVVRLETELRDREEARKDLLTRLAKDLSARGITYRLDARSGVLRLSEDVPFNTNRSDLTDRTRRTVQVLAEILAKVLPCFSHTSDRSGCGPGDAPVLEAVLIEGHTDRQGFGGLPPQLSQLENDRLSTARALTVFAEMRRLQPSLDALHNGDNVPLLGVSGYGERRPLPEALGSTEADFSQNRRIDLRFVLSSRTSEEVRRLIEDINRLRQQPE